MAMLDTACLTTTRGANLWIKRQAQPCWGAVRISLSLKSGLGLLARLDAPMSAAVRRVAARVAASRAIVWATSSVSGLLRNPARMRRSGRNAYGVVRE